MFKALDTMLTLIIVMARSNQTLTHTVATPWLVLEKLLDFGKWLNTVAQRVKGIENQI
jgi:hypothetical protein